MSDTPKTRASTAAEAQEAARRLALGGAVTALAPLAAARKRRRLAVILGGVLATILAGYIGLPADTLAPILAAVLDLLCDSASGICGD